MDFVKREDPNVIDEENYKVYVETLQLKSQQIEMNDYQHTPISMEQLHQAMQSSLNAGSIMHNFQLPLSPRQMSTLMLKTNHLSRNLNFNDIPAHLQRNLELDLVHNLTNELPQNLRHDDVMLGRNIDLNLARSLSNELELQNSLTQTLVQNLNDNLTDINLPQNLRTDIPHDLNHQIDLSHHLNRNLEHELLQSQERRTLMHSLPENMLEQSLAQRLDPNIPQRLDQTLGQRLDQRMVTQNMSLHENQRLENEHLLPMPFHIKSEQDDDGYFYENINQAQPLPGVNTMNGHIPDHSQNQNVNPESLYVYSNHVTLPAISNMDLYPRPQSQTQYYAATRDNPQNLVMHRQFENNSPYEDPKKDGGVEPVKIDASKPEEPKENLKPADQNKIYYQEYPYEVKNEAEKVNDLNIIPYVKGKYACSNCNDILTSKRLLKQHSKTCMEAQMDENGEKQGKFVCSQCSYRCQAPATLKIHERIHTGDKPYACNFCSYKSGQKNNVAKHILVHMKQKPFRCQYCDYRCAQKNNLVVHERTHTGYKPFACPYCDYRTVQKPNLVKHMYLHTDQKPFSCDICNYRCVQKTNLTKHKQRHLNEKEGEKLDLKNQVKPYRPRQKSVKCPHCVYRCVQKASLEKHIMFKHSEFADQGLNLMKSGECEEPVQNLSVKKDAAFENVCPDSLQVQS
ncbi:zinc finger protein 90-like [Ostrinia furnacalis]|uniref:zinc finger protein 90-like n=1 Tax=Ostrinia furnacalis TaxID=93504 RepID=UPI00103BC7CE|nr:zinc finger protein 90-like [Ostrinia furnacalis]